MWRRVPCEQQLDTLFLSVEEIKVFQARTCEQVCRCRETGALRAVLRAVARLAQCALMERSFPSAFSFPVVRSISCTACLFMLTDALDDS